MSTSDGTNKRMGRVAGIIDSFIRLPFVDASAAAQEQPEKEAPCHQKMDASLPTQADHTAAAQALDGARKVTVRARAGEIQTRPSASSQGVRS